MYFPNLKGASPYSCSEYGDEEEMFRSKVNLLWQEECLVDVSLACENKVLTAHKLVLSAYSDYFKEMFTSMKNMNQYPIIFMKDISCDILKAVLEFMYRGEVNVPQNSLHLFMKTALSLRVKGINISDEIFGEIESQSGKRRRGPKIESQDATPSFKKARRQRRYSHSDYDDDVNSATNSYDDEPKLHPKSLSHPHVSDNAHRSLGSHYSTDNDEIHSSQNLPNSGRFKRHLSESHYSSKDITTKCRPSNSRQSSESRDSRNTVDQSHAARQLHATDVSSFSSESRCSLDRDSANQPKMLKPRKNSSSSSVMPERKMRRMSDSITHSRHDKLSQGSLLPERKCAGISKNSSAVHDSSLSENEEKNLSDENDCEMESQNLFKYSRTGNYKMEDLMKALRAMKDGWSLKKTSELYNIPIGTLSKKHKIWKERSIPENVVFEKEYEDKLVKLIDYMTKITPLTCNQVKMFAWAIDSVIGNNNFGDHVPSKTWWAAFMKKNPNIITVLRQYDFIKLSQMKSDTFSFKALADYLVPVQEIIEAFDLNDKPENFWSCSEYSLSLTDDPEECLTPARSRFIKGKQFPSERTNMASILFAGSASGKKVPPFVTLKDVVPTEDATKEAPAGTFYDKSATGFMDSNLLFKWFEHVFLPQCPKSRSIDSPVILLLNSSFPLAPQMMLDMAESENVILLSLMPHLHHACQPMDSSVIKGFKVLLRDILKRELEANKGKCLLDLLPKLIKEPFDEGIKSNMVTEGFHICGVFPLTVNVDQKKYLELRSLLDFDKVRSCLRKEAPEIDKATSSKTQSRKIKLLQENNNNTSSDEDDFLEEEESNCCYVCGKDPPEEGSKESTASKWMKCSKRYCKNLSCEECLPFDLKDVNEFVCIDCNH